MNSSVYSTRSVAVALSLLSGLAAHAQPHDALSGRQRLTSGAAFEEKAKAWTDSRPHKLRERMEKRKASATSPERAARKVPSPKGIAPADGCEWAPDYAFGGLDGPVYAQAVFDDGSGPALFVGGDFLTAAGIPVFGIAKWDGTSWSPLGSGMDDTVFALAVFDDGGGEALYGGGFFTTAGGVPAVGIAKWDGVTWSPVGSGVDDSVFALAVFDDGGGNALYAGGFFTTAGGSPASNIAKWDGAAWSPLGSGVDEEVDALAVFDDGSGAGPALYVGGFFLTAGGVPADNIASWDGASWSPLGLGTSDGVVALAVFDDGGGGEALYAGGFFIFADGGFVFGIAKWDGTGWSDLDGGMDFPVLALTVFDDGGGEALYAGGIFAFAGPVEAPGIARWDGTSWSALGTGIPDAGFLEGEVASLAVYDDGGSADLYVGGFFFEAGGVPAAFLASWDGAAWSAVLVSGPGFQGMDDVVLALTVFDDGGGPALYAGGDFFSAGGVPAFGIAKWDGTSWSPLGSGMSCLGFPGGMRSRGKGIIVPSGCFFPRVEALAVYDDGTGPALYAGGEFDFAGGVPASNVAKWDGTSWSALGLGTDAIVEALAVYDDGGGPDLYAGGEFDFAGGLPASKVARWDGVAWSALGLGVDLDVETLVVFDDGGGPDLYAGGEFTSAGGLPASYVARWDGAAWSALGAGTDGEVETLLAYDDGGGPGLYAGGAFDFAGGLPAASIARWDGAAWSAVGSGMVSLSPFRTVDALAVFDDGGGPDLYAGGFFDFAGGLPAVNIARWDGAAWSALGAGVDEEVEALAVYNVRGPSLYAGGFFTHAGGLASSFIGEWRCPAAELSIDDVTLAEGDTGTTDFVFTVTRSHAATDLSVDVATADGSATAGFDYTALPLQTIAFAAGGALSVTVTVAVTADTIEEVLTKDFFVNLSAPVAATIADGQGAGTILDDDDTGPPVVTVVDSTAGTGDGELAECEEARVAVTSLQVTFDQPVRDPAGDTAGDDVTNPANYRLFAAGADRDLGSASCGPPSGDDVAVSIDSVSYDGGSQTATLGLAGGSPLADGPYRLVVCGSIADGAGNALAGGDFARTFRVEQENLFVNGHFDCDLAGWTRNSTDPGEITYAGDDVDSASVSGSAAVTNLTSSTRFDLGQCLPASGGEGFELRGSVRLTAAPGVTLFLERTCEFFAAAGCTGQALNTAVDVFPVSDTAGAWVPVASGLAAPSGSASMFCGFGLTAPAGEDFNGRLDDLEIVRAPVLDGLIFADGFESGDTLAWSSSSP